MHPSPMPCHLDTSKLQGTCSLVILNFIRLPEGGSSRIQILSKTEPSHLTVTDVYIATSCMRACLSHAETMGNDMNVYT